MELGTGHWLRRLLEGFTPARFLVLVYLSILVVGTTILATDGAMVAGRLSFVDALFMAASALCVTGLSVVSLGSEMTTLGQVTILVLIQIGALGVMTMSTLFAMLLGRRIGLRNRIYLQEDLNQSYMAGIVRLVRYVLLLTFVVELIGAVILFGFLRTMMPTGTAVYYSVFHSVSAFGNAGFDLFGTSLEGFSNDAGIVMPIAFLLILGGLGFSVILELLQWNKEHQLSLHSRIVLWTTSIMIAISWIVVLVLEFGNPETLGMMSLGEKILSSFFTAVTPRTAGFNIVPTNALTQGSLFFVIGLMFVGASPGSTGGGIKTTTFAALILGVWATIVGKKDVELGHRRLPLDHMLKAWAITIIAAGWVVLVTLVLLIIEPLGLAEILFEVVSAFGTVGLSMGITGELSSTGRVLLSITMFMGRLGPMTLALALGQRKQMAPAIRMPEERIGLG